MGAVRPGVVVILVDVDQHIRRRLLGAEVSLRYPLGFQAPEEPLHRRIIPAIASSAHALLDPVTPQLLPEGEAGVVSALVGDITPCGRPRAS